MKKSVVVLELGALMGALGVLDGQLVEAEALGDLTELLGAGLEEPQPDELALLVAADAARGDVERQLALVLALAVLVVGAVDDHLNWLAPRLGSAPAGSLLPRRC